MDDKGEPIAVGSVAGGGRYDGLVGMFDPKHRYLLWLYRDSLTYIVIHDIEENIKRFNVKKRGLCMRELVSSPVPSRR